MDTTCSVSNAATLFGRWLLSGHVVRVGKKRNYRFYYTGKEFLSYSVSKSGKLRIPNDTYERIREVIIAFRYDWFSSSEVVEKFSPPESSLRTMREIVCCRLSRLTEMMVLERQGDPKSYRYRQVSEIPSPFSKGEIPTLVFDVLREEKRSLSIKSIAFFVQNCYRQMGKNGHPTHRRFCNAVKNVVTRWYRDGHLIRSRDLSSGSYLYALAPGVNERPLEQD